MKFCLVESFAVSHATSDRRKRRLDLQLTTHKHQQTTHNRASQQLAYYIDSKDMGPSQSRYTCHFCHHFLLSFQLHSHKPTDLANYKLTQHLDFADDLDHMIQIINWQLKILSATVFFLFRMDS